MAVYKVPQDVEAEDKLLGPFSFRQFIFILIGLGFGFLAFLFSQINPVLFVIPLPIALIFLFLGGYRRKDQPLEVYLASRISFMFNPHVRIWDQEGVIEHVRITAPKKVEKKYTKDLSSGQVQTRLQQLAMVMDTRGWAVKNSTLQEAGPGSAGVEMSDRLVAPTTPVATEPLDIHDYDDPLDESNKAAGELAKMARMSREEMKAQAIEKMRATPEDLALLEKPLEEAAEMLANQPSATPASPIREVTPAPTNQFSQAPKPPTQTQNTSPEMTIGQIPHDQITPVNSDVKTDLNVSTTPMTSAPPSDILRLSQDNDRNIDSIAREADDNELQSGDAISLH